MNQKKCLKCGQVTSYSGAVPLECSSCGAIYQKVEAARSAAAGEPSRPFERPPERPTPRPNTTKRTPFHSQVPDHKVFAETMRSESLYPTWRELVKWITYFWYAVAIIIFLVTATSTSLSPVPTGGALVVALALVIFARATKELSLMLTDLADAAVRMASEKEKA